MANMFYECERCESHTVTVIVTSNGCYVCRDCWVDGDDKE